MIDGAKALAAGIKKVLGDDAVVQRCRLRKRRNVAGHLPKELAGTIDKRLALIFAQPDADKELDAAKRLANELEADRGSLGSTGRSSEPADGAIGQPCHILLAHGVIVVRKPNI